MTRPKVPDDKRQRTAQACDSCKRRKQKVGSIVSIFCRCLSSLHTCLPSPSPGWVFQGPVGAHVNPSVVRSQKLVSGLLEPYSCIPILQDV
ncbi:uncharacterized protein B0T15DRAFT_404011 [Chaetomium strumarium]|uniref:Uncharacterized protein n=1 Tax=Chaetomium strumarium TaxID=1170767 RepID=A0AAJ0GLA4_9PEZI|nr:hypothetical protein B0T15DRAFT_404011 [Chaetomium strumarium]